MTVARVAIRLACCPKGHDMLALGSSHHPSPIATTAAYSDWNCDASQCSAGSARSPGLGRFHCATCQHDVCENCYVALQRSQAVAEAAEAVMDEPVRHPMRPHNRRPQGHGIPTGIYAPVLPKRANRTSGQARGYRGAASRAGSGLAPTDSSMHDLRGHKKIHEMGAESTVELWQPSWAAADRNRGFTATSSTACTVTPATPTLLQDPGMKLPGLGTVAGCGFPSACSGLSTPRSRKPPAQMPRRDPESWSNDASLGDARHLPALREAASLQPHRPLQGSASRPVIGAPPSPLLGPHRFSSGQEGRGFALNS